METDDDLIKALKDADSYVRQEAAFALEYTKTPQAIAALIEVMETDTDEDVRTSATNTLGQIGDRTALPALVKALQEGSDGVRAEATSSLRKLGGRRIIRPLIEALNDPVLRVKQGAAHSLASNLSYNNDYRVFKPFLQIIEHEEDSFFKKSAIEGLGHLGDSKALEPLLKLATDKTQTEEVQAEAILALSKLKASQSQRAELGTLALQLLTQATQAGQELIIENCAEALGELGAVQAVDFLSKLLKNFTASPAPDDTSLIEVFGEELATDPDTAHLLRGMLAPSNYLIPADVIEALGKLGDDKAAAPLLEVVLNHNVHVHNRQRAAEALTKLGYSTTIVQQIPNLKAFVRKERENEKTEGVRIWLLGLLTRYEDEGAVDELLEMAVNPANKEIGEIAEALTFDGYTEQTRQKIISKIREILKDRASDSYYYLDKYYLFELLRRLGDPKLGDLLIAILEDNQTSLNDKATAIDALGRLGDKRALPFIEANMEIEHLAYDVRDALVAIGQPSFPILLKALKHSNSDLRWHAAIGLGKLGDKNAAPALEEALGDEDGDVKFRAFEALVNLGLRDWAEESY